MAKKSELEVGQRVLFLRTHDKSVQLTGTIVKIHDDSDCVDVETEADGRLVEVSTVETAHAADVTPIAGISSIEGAPNETPGAQLDGEEVEEDTGTSGRRGRKHR